MWLIRCNRRNHAVPDGENWQRLGAPHGGSIWFSGHNGSAGLIVTVQIFDQVKTGSVWKVFVQQKEIAPFVTPYGFP
ncbi:MAG TPA: hypothetical protein VGQ93_02355 [Lysobacter sp.]|jgi:hypothetical protein|nr:hypothetical protein [Lysobacter sp.]